MESCKQCGKDIAPCGRNPKDGHWHHVHGDGGGHNAEPVTERDP